MRLVENYLSQASQLLPKDLREDVIDELRTSLEEQVIDRASAMAANLTSKMKKQS